MRGRYFVRNKALNTLFRAIDAFLWMFAWAFPHNRQRPVQRLLIANGAHLGDVVLATAVLPALKEALPGVRIGMLVGSWSAPLVRDHPLLDWVHVVDHWSSNRGKQSLFEKFAIYLRTRRHALREIRKIDYDCAVDLYFYFPNSIALLRQCGIPQRIGYTSAGFGPLLTQRLDLRLSNRSIVEYHLDLLRLIPEGQGLRAAAARPILPRTPLDTSALTGGTGYIVLHMGSGSPLKDWPVDAWHSLVGTLSEAGHRLVFTGSGARERDQVMSVIGSATQGVDLCDRLKWREFVEVVAGADLLVGVDSVAGHIAAAVGTPVIVIGNGMNNPFLWRPASAESTVMMQQVPCAPCYRKTGCTTMTCIRSLSAAAVATQVFEVLARRASEASVLPA